MTLQSVTDLVQSAALELYGLPPEDFLPRRKALTADAKAGGDKDAAGVIGALRKPSRSAWLVNRLARSDRDLVADLVTLGGEFREAEMAVDAPRMRELTAERRKLTELLVSEAFADERPPSASLRDEVRGTFIAALADPEIATQVQLGVLVRAASWDGFGSTIPADELSALPGITLSLPESETRSRPLSVRDAKSATSVKGAAGKAAKPAKTSAADRNAAAAEKKAAAAKATAMRMALTVATQELAEVEDLAVAAEQSRVDLADDVATLTAELDQAKQRLTQAEQAAVRAAELRDAAAAALAELRE